MLLSLSGIGFAQQNTPNKTDAQPMDDAILHGFLPNGLAYYVRKNVTPKKRAVMYLVERAGSLQEDDNQSGMAHFIEHMAFHGTRAFPKDELVSYLQKAGVKFGADVNAHTGYSQTTYELTLPTDSMDVFNKGLDILNDWAGYVNFDQAEIEVERGIVLEEARLRERTAYGRMNNPALELDLNYSRFIYRVPIGKEQIIKNFTPEALKKFYHDWYRPDLQAIIIVGDVNPRQVVRLIKEKFSGLQNPPNERKLEDYSIPVISGTRVKVITDKETPYTSFSMTVRLPGTKVRTNTEYLQRISSYMLNYMLSARINEIIKKGDPPFLNARAYYGTSIGNTDMFVTRMLAKPGELENSVKTIITELERAKRFGFTEEELKTAKAWFLGGRASAMNDMANQSSLAYVEEYERNFLEDESCPGLEYEYYLTRDNLPTIHLSEINALMEAYTSDQNRVITLEAPEKDAPHLPDKKTLLDWVNNPGKEINAYQEVKVDKDIDILPYELKPGKIESDKSDGKIGTQTFILSNGAKVILKNTSFHKGQILFEAFAPGGNSLAPEADFTSVSLASSLVSKSGVAAFDQSLLDKILSNKGLGMSPYIDGYVHGIRGGSSQRNIETAFKLLNLYFTAPRKDATVWAGQVSQRIALLASKDNSPIMVLDDTARAILNNYNFRAKDPSAEKLTSADMNKAYSFYRERFADASNFTFIFVGDLDDIGIRGLIKEYIGSLPSTHSNETYNDLNMNPPPGKITKIIHKGIDDKSEVELIFNGAMEYNQPNKLQLNAIAEILQIKLIERLREQEKSVYAPRVEASYTGVPVGRYLFYVQFACGAANVYKLIAASMDEIEKIKQNGALPLDIKKFTANEERSMQLKLKDNIFWLQRLSFAGKNKEDADYIVDYVKSLDDVTVETTKETANKYLSGDNLIQLILLPETK